MKKLTKKQRVQWAQQCAQLIEREADSSLYDFFIQQGDVDRARRHEGPTKNQHVQWAQLLERYAASDDSEQTMVVDIMAYLSGKLEGRHRAGITLIDQVTSMGRKPRESGSEGGKKTKYQAVHDFALKIYDDDPDQSYQSVAEYVAPIANGARADFGLSESETDEVKVRTVRDMLSKNVNKRKTTQQR